MLRELGPEDPRTQGWVLIIGAAFFLLCGLNYTRLADLAQRKNGHSDKVKAVSSAIMRPLAFLLAAMAIAFAYMFFTGRA